MKRFVVALIVVGAAIAIVLVVFQGDESSSSAAPVDPMTGRSEFDIPVQDPALVAEGAVLYASSCAACHGSDLRGTAVGPSHLSVIYNPYHHGDGAFAVAALSGVQAHHWNFGDMPPIPGLSQGDLERIVAFVRESQRIEGFEAYPP